MMKSLKAQASSKEGNPLKISVYWGDILYDTAVCYPHESITIGRRAGNTFVLPTKESLKLVEVLPNDMATIQVDNDFDGHLRLEDKLMSLSAAKESKQVTQDTSGLYQIRLSKKDKADVVIGHVSFYFEWLYEQERIPKNSLFDKKRSAFILGVIGTVLFLFLVLTLLGPLEEEKPPERLVTLLPPKQAPAKAALGEHKTKDGGAEKGEAGKAELKTPEQAKPSAVESLKKANLGSIVSGLTSLGGNAPSVNAPAGAVAPLQQQGTGGFTTEGMKTGAGGKSVGIGRTVGQGEGGFEGTGRLGLAGNSAVEGGTGYGSGDTRVEGGLDPEVIESVIRRRLDRIRLCYERQLNFHPKLSGKVTVHFAIGKRGEVLSSNIVEDTMSNENVRSCILAEVKSWNFPSPEGGTIVNVDYPFVFESSAHGH